MRIASASFYAHWLRGQKHRLMRRQAQRNVTSPPTPCRPAPTATSSPSSPQPNYLPMAPIVESPDSACMCCRATIALMLQNAVAAPGWHTQSRAPHTCFESFCLTQVFRTHPAFLQLLRRRVCSWLLLFPDLISGCNHSQFSPQVR